MSEPEQKAANEADPVYQRVEQDIWAWIHEFVTVPSEFYDFKFPPCPYARGALINKTVDVKVWLSPRQSGDVKAFIKQCSEAVRETPTLTTRVMAFPPKVRFAWGINDYVELLNTQLIKDGIFLNTGTAKSTTSRYPGPPSKEPYFIVIANSLGPVLEGAESLAKTDYYKDWPGAHYELVVERRARMAKQYGFDKK